MITKKSVLFLLFFITTNIIAIENTISVTEPWIRSAPPTAKILGAFMNLHNDSNKEVRLTRVVADKFNRIEIHRTSDSNGFMKMVRQDYVPIPAQGSISLKPGSWHMMIINPIIVPVLGEEVTLELEFDNNTKISVSFKIMDGLMQMKHK
jgi:hypothetical protein